MNQTRHRNSLVVIGIYLLVSACQSAPPSATSEVMPTPIQATAPVSPTMTPAPLPTITPSEITLPADYTFVFQGQTPEFEAGFRDSILRAYRWLRDQGVTETGPFTAFVIADRDQWVQAMVNFFQMPEAWTRRRISDGSHYGGHGPGWLTRWAGGALYELGERQGLVGDGGAEYLQAVMLNLAGLSRTDTIADSFPAWLIQGSENYLYIRMRDTYEHGYFAAYKAQLVTEGRIHSSLISGTLLMSEPYGSTQVDPAVVGVFGLEYLGEHYGGDNKIIEWHRAFKNRQPGQTWRDVFQQVYGIPIQEFYDAFEDHKATRYPRVYHDIKGLAHGRIGHAENGPEWGLWVFACPENPPYDCTPSHTLRVPDPSTNVLDPFWTWWVDVPMKIGDAYDVTIAFARTADRASIFGYYTTEGGFTTDINMATVIHLESGDVYDTGTLDLPEEFLPPTITPTQQTP